MLKVECKVHFERGCKSRKQIKEGPRQPRPEGQMESGRMPRVTRLLALAIRMERLLREGVARDYADLARLGGVTRARITQIMNLTLLAPDIQEEVLNLPRITQGRDPVAEPDLRSIATVIDWGKQRRLWKDLVAAC